MSQTISLSTFSRGHLAQRFLGRLREAEINRPGEVLFASVNAPRGQQFLGPDHAHFVALFAADQVLPAFSAGQSKIGRSYVASPGQISQ